MKLLVSPLILGLRMYTKNNGDSLNSCLLRFEATPLRIRFLTDTPQVARIHRAFLVLLLVLEQHTSCAHNRL